ncbi:MAG: sporulation protein YqfD [Blautia sp.]|jgi:similar to stage IV sporulation protein
MKSITSHLHGYVRIRFWCEKPERFLNLCAHHQILISNLTMEDGIYTCQLPVKDFKNLRTICRKTHTKVRITGKYGLPFFFYRNKKRKAFFIGILLSLCLIGFLSTRVWNIHIEGNYSNSTQVLLEFLEKNEIRHGIAKKDVNCAKIAALVRKEFTDVTWVSAKLLGTQLSITVQENDVETAKKTVTAQTPCDLVADKSGQIVRMITRAGVPAVTEGQTVKKGDVLVEGTLPILNDAQEVIRYEYVHSDADIYLSYTYRYEDEFPLVHQTRAYTGNYRNQYYLQLLDKRITVGLPYGGFERYDAVSFGHPVYLTENFLLPVTYGKTTEMEYVRKKEKFTKKQAMEQANEKLVAFLQKLLEKGVQIYQNNVKIEVTDSQCTSKGNLILIEKIGSERTIADLSQPMERNTTDEQ